MREPEGKSAFISAEQAEQAEPEFGDKWSIIRICGVEEITYSEWTQGISVSISEDNVNTEDIDSGNSNSKWGERKQNFRPRVSRWIPMAWIPRPIGEVQIIPGERIMGSMHTRGEMTQINQRWRGNTGIDSSGYGWRGRVFGECMLPGMMSELGAFLREREGEENGREGRRMRGLRW